jgi:2-methylcitrate dehydratase PrpD
MDINYAQLCAQFAAARILIAGDLVTEDFTATGRSDPDTLTLADKVQIIVDDNPDPNALTPVTVDIETHGGAHHEIAVDTVYGHPDNPMTRQDWLKKFRSNWQHAAVALGEDARERVIEQVENLPTVVDTARIIDDLLP